ncbi:DHA2 family efflux MFS transporter permease subunit [Roseomonas sp. NAR14]|uniref:DHA2 family efflux MFS transporter permease subunit n=1 Tax=Roseomonas acroporae TaxID=2937791 RepID=A0A9X1YAV1_9PROT|nr:DHA2 family efflux MFS transporter permease subunit [Roseomonas acroporae]MCK8786726.1 DHA2 family efflux MFS transporter permease subunit [Roseomonas acroporae]
MSGAASRGWKPRYNPWLVAVTVTLGAFMEVLDTTIVNVSLPHIAGSLSVSNDESTWTLTTYLVANGIVLTISGSLSRMLGRKRYFLICIGCFTVASFACGLATEFWQIILFRALQGFFGGGLQPTQQAIILDSFPPEKRSAAFSLTAIAIIIAPILGPVVGGYLTDTYSWHWIFLINVPVGLITFFGVLQVVEDPPWVEEEHARPFRFDYVGLGFIVLALGGLEIAVDRGENEDWLDSSFIRITALLSVIGFVGGITWLLRAKHPIVDLRVFKDRNFALGCVLISIMGFVLYASAVLIPQLAQQQFGYTATWSGLVLTPGAVVLVLLIPLVGKSLSFIPAKYVIAFGGLVLGSSLLYSQGITPDIDFAGLALMRATQTAGLAFLFVPISTLAYATLPKELNGDATALFTMCRNVLGGIGISVSTALVQDHMQIRQAHMVGHLSPTNEPYNVLLQQLRQAFVDHGYSAAEAAQLATGQVFQMLRAQVAVLAYGDVFIITACLAFLIIPAALMMSGLKVQGGGGGH